MAQISSEHLNLSAEVRSTLISRCNKIRRHFKLTDITLILDLLPLTEFIIVTNLLNI
jgi:hypothetical protein